METQKLTGLPSTLLITVWARAAETLSSDPLIEDPYAVEIYEKHKARFSGLDTMSSFVKRSGTLGCAIRTRCFDREVSAFIEKHPTGTIINIGCGLDARSLRLDNGQASWFDIDMPEVQTWRRELLPSPSPRHHIVDGSLLEPDAWLPELSIDAESPVFFISEGTLMYFDVDVVRRLFSSLVDHIGSFTGYTELVGDLAAKQVHPAVRAVGDDSRFRFASRDPQRLFESVHEDLVVLKKETLFDHERSEWGFFRWVTSLFPSLKERLASVLVGFSIEA